MASISIPEPRQILIKPFDASALKELMKALHSDLGAAPQKRRQGAAHHRYRPCRGAAPEVPGKVKEMCEETRVAMRNTRARE
jgi:ribosome recycling factor